MSRHTTYKCDLCHSEMIAPSDGIALKFGYGVESPFQKVDAWSEAGAHLCNGCIKGLKFVFNMEMEEKSDAK